MSDKFDDILGDALRAAEVLGADAEAVAGGHPEHAAELAAHFDVLSSLKQAPPAVSSDQGMARGLARLRSEVRNRQQTQGGYGLMNKGIFGLAGIGAVAIVGFLAIGIALSSGNLTVDVGADSAEATDPATCLNQVLGGFAEPNDVFDIDDVLAIKAGIESQDPALDRDNDGDVDVDDAMTYIQELQTCISQP